MPRVLWLAVLAACSSGPEPSGTSRADEPSEPVVVESLPQGPFLVGLSIGAIGGLLVPFQLDVQTTDPGDGPRFERFDLRAVGEGDSLSDVLVGVTDVAVDPAGGFDVVLPQFTLPAEYVITGGDVDVEATFGVEQIDAGGLCGTVGGSLVTFGIDLAGSTFGAVPWADRALGPATSCDPGGVQELPRLDPGDCPALVEGANAAFPSGGRDRSFEVAVPSAGEGPFPLVIVYHGYGGDGLDMLDETDLRRYADELGVILVAPHGEPLGGTTGWDAFSDPRTNPDLALFDDLVTCAGASFDVDPDRIHVTGMSNGGLMTGYLVATRSDVIASAAPLSGGVGTEVIDTGYDLPVLVVWGGEADLAFDQDFDLLAAEQIELFTGRGRFVVACDHGLGHTLLPSFWPWVLRFLLDHPRDLAAEPYAAALPPEFPDYCVIQ